ncbi:MAG TPA: DHHA1 domain-containing protein [Terriglobales bacterium]|nr:DHHA1 domain-containing protein [Terriglobales bacterium]
MTEHLYYHDSFLYEFDAVVAEFCAGTRPAIILNQTAFYPTSGGQVFDTGWIVSNGQRARVIEVAEEEGKILHYLEPSVHFAPGLPVHGVIDIERRRDHMQQHSGQHVLSAAFVRLFNMATVSFHMGEDYCSIDLDTKTLSAQQVEAAEKLANEVVLEDRSVEIRFVTQEQAQGMGLRKLPPVERDKLRLIEVKDFDLTACGGTHVRSTGQIGAILLRKTEKVKQGWRVEFVCGTRAVKTARGDYTALTEAAGLFSSALADVPQQVRKTQEELRGSRKGREQLLAEIAELYAEKALAETAQKNGRKIVTRIFPDRDLAFIKLMAQKATRQGSGVVALLASTASPAALVFAESPDQTFDMGALMKEALAELGGRGGGSRDMAQGGPQQVEAIGPVLAELEKRISDSAKP